MDDSKFKASNSQTQVSKDRSVGFPQRHFKKVPDLVTLANTSRGTLTSMASSAMGKKIISPFEKKKISPYFLDSDSKELEPEYP